MISNDKMRVMLELKSFSVPDLAEAFEVSSSAAQQQIEEWLSKKVVYRVRAGKAFLYALSEKWEARAAALPPIDPNERPIFHVGMEIIPEEPEISVNILAGVYDSPLPDDWFLECSMCGKPMKYPHEGGRCGTCDTIWNG